MPPAKVRIERISGDRTRQNTFHKRKLGLIKKAIELTVLTDCECVIILRSAPTVTCREGKIVAYCNKDLEKMLKSVLEHPPADYYTNASYSRFSKDDIVLDEGDGATGPAALEMECGSSLVREGGQQDGEDAGELRERMKLMEKELNRLRAMVPQAPGSQSTSQHATASEPLSASRSDTFKQSESHRSTVVAMPISRSSSATKNTGAAETSPAQRGSAEETGVITPQHQPPVKLERQSSTKKRAIPSPGEISFQYATGNWSGAKRRIKDLPAENIGRIGRINTPSAGEKQEATEALQAALVGVMSSTNVAEPLQHPFMDGQGHVQETPMFASSEMVPAQPHSGCEFGEEFSHEPSHRPSQGWQLPLGYHPHPHSQTGMEQSEQQQQQQQHHLHHGQISQPGSGAEVQASQPTSQTGSWPGMHAGFAAPDASQLAREDSWDFSNMLGNSTTPQKRQWYEENVGWSPGKALLSPLVAQTGLGCLVGSVERGHPHLFSQHLPECSPKH